MEAFISGLGDPALTERMLCAVEGVDAFRRFEGALIEFPEEQAQWHALSDERGRGRTRFWLAAAGYCPAPPITPRVEI